MELKILITTPKGQAKKTEKKLRTILVGRPDSTYTNDEDNQIVWEVSGSVRKMMDVHKRVIMFDKTMEGFLKHKLAKKAIGKFLDKAGQEELDEMLLKQTKVRIIKKATSKELEDYNLSWWARAKQHFKKHETRGPSPTKE